MAEALRVRTRAGLGLEEAVCVYDLAEHLGIEVRFTDIPSMEGMYYLASEPSIILSSLRPPGRRVFTCAHELGHHSNGDGTTIDQLVQETRRSGFDTKEFAADCFGAALLMPKMAVQRAFSLREWNVQECTSGQAYTISNYFGVGYSTLVHHMRSSLRLLPEAHASSLLNVTARKARAQAIGWDSRDVVWVLDQHWTGRAVDAEVGDLVLVKARAGIEGRCIAQIQEGASGCLFRACRPGIGRVYDDAGWSVFVRVSRRGFVGRSIFRHLEEVDEEGTDRN